MPSCLGIYTDNNMIKYAKVTSATDKITGTQSITVDNYGVKFYDNIQASFAEIANEVGIEQVPLGLTLSNEDYYITHVFSNLKKKDMIALIASEYAEKKGEQAIPSTIIERRVKLAANSDIVDKSLALCISTTQGELANINQNFQGYRIASISPMPVSIKNLFENQAIDEEAAVINIENKTTITVFHRNEIQYLTSLSLGASEIINKLSEKYNSSAKAYEACKKVSAYLEDSYDMDDETRDILDIIIPILYDIRQQVDAVLTPYMKNLKKIYITGTGSIINNIDLYFSEVLMDVECEILKPFFIGRDDSRVKEIMEVNSAVALALDGVGMVDDEFNFNTAAKKAAGTSAIKESIQKLHVKERISEFSQKSKDLVKKLNAPVKAPKRKKKRNVDFDEGLLSGNDTISATDTEETENDLSSYGMIDVWLTRAAVLFGAMFIIYFVGANITSKKLIEKSAEVASEKVKVEAAIATAESDATYLNGLASDYVEITNKLSLLIAKINEQSQKTFDIPNFLSKVMFIIPANVQVSSIDVSETGSVEIHAQSGQYAQLGYFVSRVKLERALLDVDMEIVSVDSDIKIKISGVLP